MRGNSTEYYASAIGGFDSPLLCRYLSGTTKYACDMSAEEDLQLAESVPRTRKGQKLTSKDCIHGLHDLDMDVMMPYVMDDRRKRRMNSNRASAQRSRQRKQERLDELEVLTAQLRLQNACLLRKLSMAVQLAKKYEEERNILARKTAELEKQLVRARETCSDSVTDSGDDSVTTQQTRTYVDYKVDESTEAKPIVKKMIKEDAPATDDKVRLPELIVNIEALTDRSTAPPSALPGATSGGPPTALCTTKSEEDPPATCAQKLGVHVTGDNNPGPQQETFFRDFYDAIESEIYDFSIDGDEADGDDARDDWMDTFAGSMVSSPSYSSAVGVVTRSPPCNNNLIMMNTDSAMAEN